MKTTGLITCIFLFVIGVFCFQNCQKTPQADQVTTPENNNSVGQLNKIDLQSEKLFQMNFIFQENKIVARADSKYEVMVNMNLTIELNNGEMTLSSDLDAAVSKYCLSPTLLNELVSILKSSQVCKSQPDLRDGKVCTQSVKMPYATLVTDKETFLLGSASDGCGSNAIDLCEQQASVLQGFLAALKTKYPTFNCK